MSSACNFRGCSSKDWPALAEVIRAAFPNEARRSSWASDVVSHPGSEWFGGEIGGRMVACVAATPVVHQVGLGHLVKCDLGPVAVLPEYQGHGLGTQLMQGGVRWIQGKGYDFSRLAGLLRFYARFGYAAFPRRYLEFPLPRRVRAGAMQVDTEFPALADGATIRPVDRARDSEAMRALDVQRNGGRVGAVADAASNSRLPGDGLLVVYEEGGQVLGWLHALEYDFDTEFEARTIVTRLAYAQNRPCALTALITHVLRRAAGRDEQRVVASLPFGPDDAIALQEGGIPFKIVDLHESIAGNMVQVLDLRGALTHLLPELQRRWAAAGWPAGPSVTLQVGSQSAGLQVSGGKLALSDERAAGTAVRLGDADFIAMALGYYSPSYLLAGRGAPPAALALLDVLFAEQGGTPLNF